MASLLPLGASPSHGANYFDVCSAHLTRKRLRWVYNFSWTYLPTSLRTYVPGEVCAHARIRPSIHRNTQGARSRRHILYGRGVGV